jgi:hypothetical protein
LAYRTNKDYIENKIFVHGTDHDYKKGTKFRIRGTNHDYGGNSLGHGENQESSKKIVLETNHSYKNKEQKISSQYKSQLQREPK